MSVWRGTKELTFGKAHVETTAGKLIVTTEVNGPYVKCLAKQPAIGQAITGFAAALRVTASKVTELDGGAGRIEITLEAGLDDSGQSPDAIGEPTYEIEYGELEKALETHRLCGKLKANRPRYYEGAPEEAGPPSTIGKGKQRTWEDWQVLDDNDYDGTGHPLKPAGNTETLWTKEQYKSLKEKGQDSYVIAAPIIRRTTIHLRKPDDIGAATGKRQNPPAAANFANVAGYHWLAGPDRCTKSKRTYTRSSEWIGAEEWNEITYPA